MIEAAAEAEGPDREEAQAARTKRVSELIDLPAVREYLNRIGAKPRSMLTAVVHEPHGRYWRDVATVRLDTKAGEFTVKRGDGGDPADHLPTEDEAARIKAECAEAIWPEAVTLLAGRDGMPPHLPSELKDVDRDRIFAFHDEDGRVVMLQHRATDDAVADGKPKYAPWTYWSDNRWRQMEPGGALPLWGLSQLKTNSVVFIHEGAKAARTLTRMVAGETPEDRASLAAHPWGRELTNAAHIGWIGGALSPGRTDWSVLKKMGVTRAYIVADNDAPGVEAVPAISKQLRIPTFAILFTDEWPAGFDLGDEFPAKLFKASGDDRRYIGPDFFAMLDPATWATDLHKPERGGKPVPYLRDHFTGQWVYADEPELFIFKDDPRIVRSEPNLSKKLIKFSDSSGTARLLLRACDHVATLAYMPDKPTGIVTVRGQRAFNVFRPSTVKPQPGGSIAPFLEFLAYLFPVEAERKVVERWIATLIARPQTRMHFGLLLVSKTQGVGKGILATQVLAPLVGDHNVGFPSEHDIAESAFNDWMAFKRLIVVGEIYQGQSFKAYNRLKGVITDKDFTVNKKHQAPYRIDNWCHVIACSNSDRALKMEVSDRRWFYPQVAEVPWPREKFAELVAWLQAGGLNIVAQWAEDRGEYIETGELPPMTPRKQVMIDESEADELRWAREYCAARIEEGESFVISTGQAFAYAEARGAKIYSTKRDLGLAMIEGGMTQVVKADGSEFCVKFGPDNHRPFVSPAALLELDAVPTARVKAWLRDKMMETSDAFKSL